MEEALSADFSFSGEAQRMERKAEKGTAFTHPVFMCLVGAPDLGSAGIPALAQPRAGHFPAEEPHDAAKNTTKFQRGNRNLAGSRQCLKAGPKQQASLSRLNRKALVTFKSSP